MILRKGKPCTYQQVYQIIWDSSHTAKFCVKFWNNWQTRFLKISIGEKLGNFQADVASYIVSLRIFVMVRFFEVQIHFNGLVHAYRGCTSTAKAHNLWFTFCKYQFLCSTFCIQSLTFFSSQSSYFPSTSRSLWRLARSAAFCFSFSARTFSKWTSFRYSSFRLFLQEMTHMTLFTDMVYLVLRVMTKLMGTIHDVQEQYAMGY